MIVKWFGKKCLFCLREEPLTEEHIIPEALGGELKCRFLCQSCNSTFGGSFEAKARTDPSIRVAVEKLRSQIPDLARKLTENQDFVTAGAGPKSRGYIQGEEFQVKSQRLNDRSLIQPTEIARISIEKILKKQGMENNQIADSLRRFDDAPENHLVALAPGLEIVNWATDSIRLDFSKNRLVSSLVPLKIAFEFLACHLGTAVYDEVRQINDIRRILREECEEDPCFKVDRLNALDNKPFHGICFEGNHPHARVLIRLFGWLTFRVHFLMLSVSGPRFIYTHLLDRGEEYVQKFEELVPSQ